MGLRYKGEFIDVDGTNYILYIFRDNLLGNVTTKPVDIIFNRDASGDLFQPIRATSLSLSLLATPDDDLSDIWNEEDRYWQVRVLKNAARFFEGYISNDGIEQPFDTDTFKLQVDALGPLAYLEDLAYVDTVGAQYSGTANIITIIARCLKRGFEDENDAFYIHAAPGFTMTDDSRFLDNAYLDQAVFLENEEPQSCHEVLESILKSIGCCIFQNQGVWRIMDIRYMIYHLANNIDFRVYTNAGASFGTSTLTPLTEVQRGVRSQIKGFPIYHVNKNQRFVNRKYLQSVRLKHVYEYKDQIIPNGELVGSGAGPYTMPNWTIVGTEATENANSVTVDGVELVTEDVVAMTSTAISLKAGQRIKLTFDLEYVTDPTQHSFEIKLAGASTYYLRKTTSQSTNAWATGLGGGLDPNYILGSNIDNLEEGRLQHVIEPEEVPIDGDLTIKVFNSVHGGAHTVSSEVEVHSITAEVSEQEQEGLEATAERNDVTKGRIDDVEEIRFATSDIGVIYNVFLDSAGTAIELIKRLIGGGTYTSLNYLAQIRMFTQQNRELIYTGDVKGEIELIGPKRTINPNNSFLVTRISKDLYRNVSSIEMISLSANSTLNIDYSERVIYKESVKPKITG